MKIVGNVIAGIIVIAAIPVVLIVIGVVKIMDAIRSIPKHLKKSAKKRGNQ